MKINPEVTVLHAKGLQTAARRLLESQPDVGCTIGAFILLGVATELVPQTGMSCRRDRVISGRKLSN